MNWIMSHNDGKDNGVVNQCTVRVASCVACAMKRLIRRYWKDDSDVKGPDPRSLSSRNSALRRVHNLADAKSAFATGVQGDPQEFLTWLLRACRDVPVPTPHRALWRERYDALFMLSQKETRFCYVCSNPRTEPPARGSSFRQTEFGFVGLSVADNDSPGFVSDLVHTHMADETPTSITRFCASCAQNQRIRKCFKMEKAPEYLTVRIQTHVWNKIKQRFDQANPIGINDILDLTQYHINPWTSLRYKLVATTDYCGNGSSGHWVATVRRHPQVYAINSGHCQRKDKAFLLRNPHDHGNRMGDTSSFQVALLVYARQY
jgi:hypothetical protein